MSFRLTTEEFWKKQWIGVNVDSWDDGKVPFIPEWHDFLIKDLTAYRGGACLEIGCFPGRYLNYFARQYGMRTEGIDFMPANQAVPHKIHTVDFFDFLPERTYDLVCSFGFIEHFQSVGEVIRRHLDLAAAGGMVLITVPNFVHGWRYSLQRMRRSDLFVHHNRNAMMVSHLSEILGALPVRRWRLAPLAFSRRSFAKPMSAAKRFGSMAARATRHLPSVDQGLATEILILVNKD